MQSLADVEAYMLAQLSDCYYRNVYKRKEIPVTNQFQGRDAAFLWEDSTRASNEKFAPVCNYNIYRQFALHGYIPKTILLLAHEVVAHPTEWEETFSDPKWNDANIIMDNSVVELGKAVDTTMIEEAVKIVEADIVVLPDVMNNGPETIEAITEVYGDWSWRFRDYELMALIQGKNVREWIHCGEFINELFSIPWLGVPRCAEGIEDNDDLGTKAIYHRRDLLNLMPWNKPVHLFGFSEFILEDLKAAAHSKVRSIDSNVPMRISESDIPYILSYTQAKRGNFNEQQFQPHQLKVINEVNRLIEAFK